MQDELIIGRQFPEKVIPLIREAKATLAIIVFDWRWYPDYVAYPIQRFNLEILQARKRGVKICAITNYRQITDILKQAGIEGKHLVHDKVVHTKIMIIDGKIAVVGSHNYTHSAFNYNHEVSVIIRDPDLCFQLTTHFNNLWQS